MFWMKFQMFYFACLVREKFCKGNSWRNCFWPVWNCVFRNLHSAFLKSSCFEKKCFESNFKCFTLRVWAGKRFAKEMLAGTVFGRFGIAFFEICTLFCIQNFAFLKSYCLEKKCFESNFKCFNFRVCAGRAKFCKWNCWRKCFWPVWNCVFQNLHFAFL